MGVVEWAKLQLVKFGPSGPIRCRALAATELATVGTDCYIGSGVTITPLGGDTHGEVLLEIGDRVAISPNVLLACSAHPGQSVLSERYGRMERIVIGDDAWIGGNATILPGVEIGAESIVCAGAVVTEDVPERTVVGGVPAETIKEIPESS